MVSGRLLMSNSSIAEGIRQAIFAHTYEIFELMEFNYSRDDIVVDECNANSEILNAIFYIKTVDNVKKKLWDEAVDFLLWDKKNIMLKTLKKESGKNVRFHLKYTTDEKKNPIHGS